jgi:hypothetical protein
LSIVRKTVTSWGHFLIRDRQYGQLELDKKLGDRCRIEIITSELERRFAADALGPVVIGKEVSR